MLDGLKERENNSKVGGKEGRTRRNNERRNDGKRERRRNK